MVMKEWRVGGECTQCCHRGELDGQRTRDSLWQRRESKAGSSRGTVVIGNRLQ